jgi:hypothetical protein
VSNLLPSQPGWYYTNNPGQPQRYFDGQQWHMQPAPVVINNIIAAPQPMMVIGGCNHVLHLLLTMFTCGMWLPIWIIFAICQQPVTYGSPVPAAPPARRRPKPPVKLDNDITDADMRVMRDVSLGLGGVLVAAGLVAAVVAYPWLLIVMLLLAGAGYLGWLQYRREVKNREIAGRADAQNQAYLAGNQSGLYGDYLPPTDLRKTD